MNFLKGSLFRRNTEPEELEPMEAPGFWTGVAIGATAVGTVIASAGLYLGVAALAT